MKDFEKMKVQLMKDEQSLHDLYKAGLINEEVRLKNNEGYFQSIKEVFVYQVSVYLLNYILATFFFHKQQWKS